MKNAQHYDKIINEASLAPPRENAKMSLRPNKVSSNLLSPNEPKKPWDSLVKKYKAKDKNRDLVNSTTKASLQMKVEYYFGHMAKDDKGMNFNEAENIWGKIAHFILSDKTSMFYDTLFKIRHPDVRDRMLHAVKRVMTIKSTMTQDNFSTKGITQKPRDQLHLNMTKNKEEIKPIEILSPGRRHRKSKDKNNMQNQLNVMNSRDNDKIINIQKFSFNKTPNLECNNAVSSMKATHSQYTDDAVTNKLKNKNSDSISSVSIGNIQREIPNELSKRNEIAIFKGFNPSLNKTGEIKLNKDNLDDKNALLNVVKSKSINIDSEISDPLSKSFHLEDLNSSMVMNSINKDNKFNEIEKMLSNPRTHSKKNRDFNYSV